MYLRVSDPVLYKKQTRSGLTCYAEIKSDTSTAVPHNNSSDEIEH
jgi:hypothetical protein